MNSRSKITNYIEQGCIDKHDIPQALGLAHLSPEPRHWYKFISQLSYWLSAIAFSCAVIFFFAYNWDAMGRFAKLAVVQSLLVLAIGSYCLLPAKSMLGKMLLFTSSLFVGALLALIGQIYQSGADPWTLFALWALLIVPWMLISQLPALYLFWIGLLTLSAGLYVDGIGYSGFVYWVCFVISSFALICWELCSLKYKWLKQAWASRILLAISLLSINNLLAEQVFWSQDASYWRWLVWGLWSLGCFFIYRFKKPDLMVLAALALSFIVVVDMHLVKYVLESAGGMLLITGLTIAMGSFASHWLKTVGRQWNQ
ncbi:DUF2157 domain-containing protein [Alginatibacterium sediminis]|uniref:DUF2157 domain-containing protein n=1 Tax=Alginatibacterium sediminis TaxID=2164068 RepID=A0A420EL41_9ALTE|nr:DUF2157 domain-containing protein [Alginatibacterium sediminis]RKF21451.1 DUF2157 domain-containing protein [Alginatibacterium sediminis]